MSNALTNSELTGLLCFTPGSLVDTATGLQRVEDLRPGDLVRTRDRGLQPLRWASRRDLDADMLTALPHLAPVLIRKGALGGGLPTRDMMLSPQHRVLYRSAKAAAMFGTAEVLLPAIALVGCPGIERAAVD